MHFPNSAHTVWPRNLRGLVLLAIGALIGCSGVSAPQSREVRIQAVIVTRSQASVPLPLLDVHVAPLEAIREAFAGWREQRQREVDRISAELKVKSDELAKAEARVVAVRDAANAADAERDRKRNETLQSNAAVEESPSNPLDVALQRRRVEDAANREFRAQHAVVEDAHRELRVASDQVEVIRKAIDALEEKKRAAGLGDIYSALPGAARSWRTDPAGFVTIMVPATEDWVLWAAATRQVGSTAEEYEWLLPVPSQLPPGGILYLSGDNLLRSGIPEWLDMD